MDEKTIIKDIETMLKEAVELSKGEIWDQVYSKLIYTNIPFEIYPTLHLRRYGHGGFNPGNFIHFTLPSYEKDKLEYCISYKSLKLRKHKKFECPE